VNHTGFSKVLGGVFKGRTSKILTKEFFVTLLQFWGSTFYPDMVYIVCVYIMLLTGNSGLKSRGNSVQL